MHGGTKGGPAQEKLFNGDQIIYINDAHVEFASRERAINLMRVCNGQLKLTVRQSTVR